MVENESPRTCAVCSSIEAKDLVWSDAIAYAYARGHHTLNVWAAAEDAFADVERAFPLRTDLDGLSTFQPFLFSVVQTAMPTHAIFTIAVCIAPQQSSLNRFLGLVHIGNEPD